MMVSTSEFRNGLKIELDGDPFIITDFRKYRFASLAGWRLRRKTNHQRRFISQGKIPNQMPIPAIGRVMKGKRLVNS